ncbi:hypothetical protein [Dysgonomonas reticulitermitis]
MDTAKTDKTYKRWGTVIRNERILLSRDNSKLYFELPGINPAA